MPNGIPSFGEWKRLEPDARQYAQYAILCELQQKVAWKRIFGISALGASFGVMVVNSPHIVNLIKAIL